MFKSRHGYKEFETPPDIEKDPDWEKAKLSQRSRRANLLEAHRGIILDTTGRYVEAVIRDISRLRSEGYDVAMLYVDVSTKTAIDRQQLRSRKVNPDIVEQFHNEVKANISEYKSILGDNFVIYNNDLGNIDTSDPNRFKSNIPNTTPRKWITKWLNTPVNNEKANKWRATQKPAAGRRDNPLHETITVPSDPSSDANIQELADIIKKKCSKYLESVQPGQFLWHGTSSKTKDMVYASKSRAVRIPVDSDKFITSLFDKALNEHGFIATRSNSIFVIGDKNAAEEYGTLYAIFPINGFNFTWSMSHNDVILSKNTGLRYKLFNPEKLQQILKNKLAHCSSIDIANKDNINQFLKGNIKKLYGITFTPKEIQTMFDSDVAMKNFNFSKENLSKAINSENEIYLSGKYIAIRGGLVLSRVCSILFPMVKPPHIKKRRHS